MMSSRAMRTSDSSVINVDHLFGDTARSLVRVSMTSRLRGCVSIAMSTVLYTTDVPPASLRLGVSLSSNCRWILRDTVHCAATVLCSNYYTGIPQQSTHPIMSVYSLQSTVLFPPGAGGRKKAFYGAESPTQFLTFMAPVSNFFFIALGP